MVKMNKTYWQKRSEQVIIDCEKISSQMERTKLKKAYQEAYKQIVQQINDVYAQLTDAGFSADMAKSLTSQEKKVYAELVRAYNADAAKLGKNGDYRPLKTASTIIKGSRLTAFKNQIEMQLNLLASKKEQAVGDVKKEVYKHASYKTVFDLSQAKGAQVAFDKLSSKQVLQAIRSNWNGRNFSSDIWNDKTKLVNTLNQLIPQQFIIGTSTQGIARQIRDKLNVSYRNAIRLARTETNFSANQAMEKTYRRAGVEKYQVLATLDSRTSKICQDMDGFIGELKNARVGENYPPFHPNCRTTTVPYLDDADEDEERIARDAEGSNYYEKNMSYKEWLHAANLSDADVPTGQTYERGVNAVK